MRDSWMKPGTDEVRRSVAKPLDTLEILGSALGTFVRDVGSGVKGSLVELVDLATNPRKAAQSALAVAAEPFTTVVDMWLPGEPVQKATERLIRNTAGRVVPNVGTAGDATKRALDSLTKITDKVGDVFDSHGRPEGMTYKSPGATRVVDELKYMTHDLYDDISSSITGDVKKVQVGGTKPKKRSSRKKRGKRTVKIHE
jgi:hypothetical protein